MLDMKVEKNQKNFYILGYLMELIIKIWQLGFLEFFFQNLTNLDHFFHEKSFII